jgi:malate synthase
MPDRADVTMTTHMMHAYSLLLIKTCHRRGIHAMGGMAAQIPIKSDPNANAVALGKVRADKEREAKDGHDGTWVAHPGLVSIAKEEFDKYMPTPNQLDKKREDVNVTAVDLLTIPEGHITENGLRLNLDVGIQYMAAWLAGNGCVPIYNLMEDAATAEISRSQIWQWLHNDGTKLDDGREITPELVSTMLPAVLTDIKQMVGPEHYQHSKFNEASELFQQIILDDQYTEFMTLPAYECLS